MKPLSLVEVIRAVIGILVDMARKRAWGEVKITVQDGQILFVHESRSYKGQLPYQEQAADAVKQVLAAAS